MRETAPVKALRARLGDGCADVGVAGLGYVGLPLAVELARAGFQVTGIDLDAKRVRTVRRGGSHAEDVASDLVAQLVKAGRPQATSTWEGAASLVMIHTDHRSIDYERVVAHACLIFDTRNATRDIRQGRTKVVRV
jgi:UDP-N-acetyl-D-mannosaminuronate dehydrogenase